MACNLSRRQLLSGAALAAAIEVAATRRTLASVTLGGRNRKSNNVLVVLFLRGGADGLNIAPPHGDADYYRLRPSLAVSAPRDGGAPAAARAIDMDGFFGLHPSLRALAPFYREGHLAVVHAVGSGDDTRSHFEAMATMERGLSKETGTASGWLARHLNSSADGTDSPLRAVAVSDTVPDSLRGATGVSAMLSLADFSLRAPDHTAASQAAYIRALREMYGAPATHPNAHEVNAAGMETLHALDAVRALDPVHYRPAQGVIYPATDLAAGLRQVACLAKGGVGLEIACLDMGGWDTHVAQGRDTGWQPARLSELGDGLAAFASDLGGHLSRVTIVVMTEFGRRAYENSGLGTDHGRASCMLLMGGGVQGGKVHGHWPGLGEHQLEDPGDLRVTTDYRDILAELLINRLGCSRLSEVFPDYTPAMRGVVAG